MGSSSHFSWLLLGILAIKTTAQTTGPAAECCKTKTVTNAPAAQEYLNGEYTLKSPGKDKPHENCADGCVYTKDGEDYCFMDVPKDESADIACDGVTYPPAGGSSPPNAGGSTHPGGSSPKPGGSSSQPGGGSPQPGGSSPQPGGRGSSPQPGGSSPQSGGSSPQPGGSTAGGSTPGGDTVNAGGSTAPQTTITGSTQSPESKGAAAVAKKAEAEKTKAKAEEDISTATKTETALKEVEKKLENAVGSKRNKRQTTITCTELNTKVVSMNDEIKKNTVAGFKAATTKADEIAKLTVAVCTDAEKTTLTETKTKVKEAKQTVQTAKIKFQIVLKEAIETINIQITIIIQVNIELKEAGKTQYANPGTALPTITVQTLAPTDGIGATNENKETTPKPTVVATGAPKGRLLFGKRSRGSVI